VQSGRNFKYISVECTVLIPSIASIPKAYSPVHDSLVKEFYVSLIICRYHIDIKGGILFGSSFRYLKRNIKFENLTRKKDFTYSYVSDPK
jgi:hypothetical protein